MTQPVKKTDEKDQFYSNKSNRYEISQEAKELRKKGELEKALVLYRELSKKDTDAYAAAGLLHCLRKLSLFDEALLLCAEAPQKHMDLDWYRGEVIWTLIQGKLNRLDESASVDEVAAVGDSILALEPKGIVAKWSIVRPVLKTAKSRSRWDIVSKWIKRVNPDELSTTPLKNDRGRDGWCDQAIWYNLRIR